MLDHFFKHCVVPVKVRIDPEAATVVVQIDPVSRERNVLKERRKHLAQGVRPLSQPGRSAGQAEAERVAHRIGEDTAVAATLAPQPPRPQLDRMPSSCS